MASVVQILKCEENAGKQKIVLDEKAFKKVVEKAKAESKPVTVISICGEYGKGKSLMANFFFQYLKNQGYMRNDLKWLKEMSDDSIACDEPGIFLFEEVIMINEIAVLILHVQGGFSIKDKNEISSQIFAMGTLLSSMQIINLQSQIQGKDVGFLKEFVEYASLIGAEVNMRGRINVELNILIRDWSYPRDNAYGYDGGMKYLDYALESSKFEDADGQFLLTKLRQMFKNIQCFLMPHPGLSIRNLEQNFQECVQTFIRDFLAPDKLFTKQITRGSNREEMSGKKLLEHAKQCIKEIYKTPEIDVKPNPVAKQRKYVVKPTGPPKPRRMTTKGTITEHETVTILNIEDGEIKLMADLLEKILLQPKIGDRPVAIISIAGTFRKGKSFILNFFLRYMRSKGYEDENGKDWKGSDDSLINDGFTWQSGINPHTQGIMMYTEPFIVDTPYDEVAVLFMDTQGLFDANTTKEKNMMIFAMNTIICSVQVLNISMNLQESDLEFLQLFTEYARMIKKERSDERFLQSLKFLIRDWQFTEDYVYGSDGGREYLEHYMEACGKTGELKEVRKFIYSKYESIGCFLMPHPGFELQKRGQEAELKDLSDDFREQLTPLMDSILNPKNLTAKRFYGKPMSARSVYASVTKYAEVISNGRLPDLATMMEVLKDANNNERRKECLEYYTEQMKKNTKQHSSDVWINAEHKKIKENAIEKYFPREDFSDAEKRVVLVNHVAGEIDNACPRFTAKLNHMQAFENLKDTTGFRGVVSNYTKMMDSLIDKPIEAKEFAGFEADCWEKAKPEKLKNLSDISEEKLENVRRDFATLRRKENLEKYDLVIEEMQMPKNYFVMAVPEEQDHSPIKEIPPSTPTKNVTRVFDAYKAAVQDKNLSGRDKSEILYKHARQNFHNSKGNFKHYVQLLEKMAFKEEQKTVKPNEKVMVNLKLRRIVNNCLKRFDEEIKQYSGLFVKKSKLESALSERKAVAVERYRHNSSNEAVQKDIENHHVDLVANLQSKIKIAEQENERNRIHFQNVKEEIEKRIVQKYHTLMDDLLQSGYIVEFRLENFHKKRRKDLEKEFQVDELPFYSDDKETDDTFANFKEDVLRKLDRLYQEKKAWNKKNHGVVVRALTNLFFK